MFHTATRPWQALVPNRTVWVTKAPELLSAPKSDFGPGVAQAHPMRRSAPLAALVALVLTGSAHAAVWNEHPLTADRLPLDPRRPVVVWVHGYDPAQGEADPLLRDLERRGYQIVRFRYDWGQDMDGSADALVRAVRALRAEFGLKRLTVVAHSQGGLVSRKAMTVGREPTLAGDVPIDLVTIASQFPGYGSANFTYLLPKVNIFGVKASHRDLRSWSPFIRHPGALGANVRHIKIETRERGKQRLENGKRVDDCSAPNQPQPEVDADPRLVHKATLDLGHVGVLRDDRGRVPDALRAVLDAQLRRPAVGIANKLR